MDSLPMFADHCDRGSSYLCFGEPQHAPISASFWLGRAAGHNWFGSLDGATTAHVVAGTD